MNLIKKSVLSLQSLINLNFTNLKPFLGLNNQNLYPVPLPSAVVLEYPVLSLSSMSPSKSLSILEPLIAFHPLMLVLSLFAANKTSDDDYNKIKNGNKLNLNYKL